MFSRGFEDSPEIFGKFGSGFPTSCSARLSAVRPSAVSGGGHRWTAPATANELKTKNKAKSLFCHVAPAALSSLFRR